MEELINLVRKFGATDKEIENFKSNAEDVAQYFKDDKEKKHAIGGVVTHFLSEKRKTVIVDWKYSLEDLLYGISLCLPGFKYKTIKIRAISKENGEETEEDFYDSNWLWEAEFEVEGKNIKVKCDPGDPYILMYEMNNILEDTYSVIFFQYDTQNDSYGFLCIPTSFEDKDLKVLYEYVDFDYEE